MLSEYAVIALELFIGFVALFIFTKVLGKSHFAQLTPFDFISALVLGELLGNAIYDEEIKIGMVLFATTLWGLLIWSIVKITQAWAKTRKYLEGEPSVIIRNGALQYDAMKKNKMDLNQLQTMLREKGYFSMDKIEFAILETNGAVSVMPKAQYGQPERGELNLPLKPAQMPVSLILDGTIVRSNLKQAGFDEAWLKKQLRKQNIYDVQNVFYAEWTGSDNLYIATYKYKGK